MHETWLRSWKLILQSPNYRVSDHLFLKFFYGNLDVVNKGVANQLLRGGIIKQIFVAACELLDDMTKINRAWYTRSDLISSTKRGPSKE